MQANNATRVPVTWLPLSQYANYFEEVMRYKGYQARLHPAEVFNRWSLFLPYSVWVQRLWLGLRLGLG